MTTNRVSTMLRDWHSAPKPANVSGPAETLTVDAPIRFRVSALGEIGRWILGYAGSDSFLRDLSEKSRKYDSLSEKQYACIERAYDAAFEAVQREYAAKCRPVVRDDNAAEFAMVNREIAASAPATAAIPNGYYTVVMLDGSHVTLRLQDGFNEELKANGTQVIGYLAGPDNTNDYRGFGFVNGNRLSIWKKAGQLPRQSEAFAVLVAGDVREAGKAYALISNNCYVCNRLLTDDQSIELGIGPVCRSKAGY